MYMYDVHDCKAEFRHVCMNVTDFSTVFKNIMYRRLENASIQKRGPAISYVCHELSLLASSDHIYLSPVRWSLCSSRKFGESFEATDHVSPQVFLRVATGKNKRRRF